jgi:hypothetical protein
MESRYGIGDATAIAEGKREFKRRKHTKERMIGAKPLRLYGCVCQPF